MNCFLHIGQTKTGSSFLQSSFAKSNLCSFGISYPIDETTRKQAEAGKITSGNYWPRSGALEQLARKCRNLASDNVLISSEALFSVLATKGEKFLTKFDDFFPNSSIKVLCFLRDPLDHAISAYQQQVKRGGMTGQLSDSLYAYDVPKETIKVLRLLECRGAEVSVRNYTNHADDVLSITEQWLSLKNGSLEKPKIERVNRSLTRSELELQRQFNVHFGSDARRFVSDPLCNELPSIKSDWPHIDTEVLREFLCRMRVDIESDAYRSLVPVDELPHVGEVRDYEQKFSASQNDKLFDFSKEQLSVVASAVKRQVIRSGNKPE